MMYDSTTTNFPLDFEGIPAAGVQLRPSSIQQAGKIGQSAIGEEQQWSVYLQALALFGFEDWLRDSSCPLALQSEQCTTLLPSFANLLSAACNLKVGDFTLCLIPTGSLGERWVNLPRAAIELPGFEAHFYVLVEVLEDCDSSQILGAIPRNLLLERVKSMASPETEGNAVTIDAGSERGDWSCRIPVDWFSFGSEDLLLWLRAADANLLSLPNSSAHLSPNQHSALQPITEQLRATLLQLQPQLAHKPIWQFLNWEQGQYLMRNPGWVNWLYLVASGATNPVIPSEQVPEVNTPSFGEQALNVGLWLQERMDAVAEELAWVLMPPLSPQMRAVQEDVDAIVGELERDGILVPTHARGAYLPLQWSELNLRLYAFTWAHLSSGNVPEWTLLLVLGPQLGQALPPDTRLLVRDALQLLVEQTSSPELDESYLYAHVVGTWEEQFWVTIEGNASQPDSAISLPPFSFSPAS